MSGKGMDEKVQNLINDVANNLGISEVKHHHHHHFVGNISPTAPFTRDYPGPGSRGRNYNSNTGPFYPTNPVGSRDSFSGCSGGSCSGGSCSGGARGSYPSGPRRESYRQYPPFSPDFERGTSANRQSRSGPHYGPGPHGPGLCSAKCYGWFPPAHCVGNYSWCEGRHGSIPHNAVKVGVDRDGGSIYAGRAFYEGDLLPAKVIPSHRCAFVPWGGREHERYEYEVLCSVHVGWTTCSGGNVPPEAICIGQTSNGERLYMGRVMHEGTLTPGKIQPSHGVLYIPYAGMEISYTEYEAMVLM